jgi:hypothetical protein
VKSQFLMYLNDRHKVDFIKHFSRAGPARPLLYVRHIIRS